MDLFGDSYIATTPMRKPLPISAVNYLFDSMLAMACRMKRLAANVATAREVAALEAVTI
jgi:hypothetical protein